MNKKPIIAITSFASLFRLEVEHFKAYSFDQDGASVRCRRKCPGTTDASSRRPMAYGNSASAGVSAAPKLVAHASVLSFCSMDQSTGSISRHACLEDTV